MQPHEIEAAVLEQLSPKAAAYWNGADRESLDELVVTGQQHGIEAAVEHAEAMAMDLYCR